MENKNLTYRQIFRTFDIQPVYEKSFCCLFKTHKRHFCVYQNKDNGKTECLYLNLLTEISPYELLSVLSPYTDLKYISLDEIVNEFEFDEKVTSDFIVKWCYSIRKARTGDNVPDATKDILLLFDKSHDIYQGEDHHLKMILRDTNGQITDLIQYHDNTFKTNFDNQFGSWNYRPDTSSLLHQVFTLNPYLIPPFYEENNQYHYHTHIVSHFNLPEFTDLFMKLTSDKETSIDPSFFMIELLNEYTEFIEFLCNYATAKSRKNFFRTYLYTDHLVLEIIPFDSPLGYTGLSYKSWQTMFSKKFENLTLKKWQNLSGIYTEIPLKIDVIHQLCFDFIHLNKFSIRMINRTFENSKSDLSDDFIDENDDEQVF